MGTCAAATDRGQPPAPGRLSDRSSDWSLSRTAVSRSDPTVGVCCSRVSDLLRAAVAAGGVAAATGCRRGGARQKVEAPEKRPPATECGVRREERDSRRHRFDRDRAAVRRR